MPVIDFPIPETTTRILEPVTDQIVRAVLTQLGVQDIFQDSLYIRTEYMGASRTTDRHNRKTLSGDRCDVTVDQRLNPRTAVWDGMMPFYDNEPYGVLSIHNKNFVPLFNDTPAGVFVVEHMVTTSLVMDFSLQFKDREDAHLCMQRILRVNDGNSTPNLHDITYSCPLTAPLAMALLLIHKQRALTPARDFMTYLKERCSGEIDVEVATDTLTDPEPEAQITIKRAQLACLGNLEFDMPRPDVALVEQVPDRFVVNFKYNFQFQRPDGWRMVFPVVVDNTLVPEPLIPQGLDTDVRSLAGVFQDNSLNGFAAREGGLVAPIFRMPVYDDWNPTPCPALRRKYRPFFIAAFTIDEPATVIDLKDLGDVNFHPVVQEILKLHSNADLAGTSAIFNLTVFSNDTVVAASRYSLDGNLVLTLPLTDTTKRYHLVLSEVTDFSCLADKWWAVLVRYRTFFPLSILRNFDSLVRRGLFTYDSTPLLDLLERCMRAGKLVGHIATLIARGHATAAIYDYTLTAAQFADHICSTYSLKTGTTLLYEELVVIGIEAGCVDPNNIPSPYVKLPNGYPIGRGGIHGTRTPLRVFDVRIIPARQPGAAG